MKRSWLSLVLVATLVSVGCSKTPPEEADDLTVGKVQAEISVGMDGASVAQILGSPNIVTTDEERRETWIYDKISSDRVSESSRFGGGIIILGGSKSKSSSSRTQKTLTIIIYFDEEKKVRDFAYNYSQF